MSIFKNLIGTMKSLFKIGGPSGNAIRNETDGLSARQSDGSTLANFHVAQATGSQDTHAVNFKDLRESGVLLTFAIDGTSPPTPGDNTGNFGIVTKSGGTYNAGEIYYDDGSSLTRIKVWKGMHITTGPALTGDDLNLQANAVYAAHSSTPPYTWTLKGDGAPDAIGYVRRIKIPIGTSATYNSSTAIPAGARVMEVQTEVTNPYPDGTTIEVSVVGSSDTLVVQPTSENDPTEANLYISDVEGGEVTSASEGPVRVTIGGSPASGAGVVIVKYVEQFLA